MAGDMDTTFDAAAGGVTLTGVGVATLLGLGILAAVLFAGQGVLEFIRGRILSRIGAASGEVDKHSQWTLTDVTITSIRADIASARSMIPTSTRPT